MNIVEYAENELKYYGAMQCAIYSANIKIKRLEMKTAPKGAGIAQMEITGIHGQNRAGNTLDDMGEIMKLKEIIAANEAELSKLDKIFDEIQKSTKSPVVEVLKGLYIYSMGIDEIAEQIGKKKAYVYEIRQEGLRLLAIYLFGIKAINVI